MEKLPYDINGFPAYIADEADAIAKASSSIKLQNGWTSYHPEKAAPLQRRSYAHEYLDEAAGPISKQAQLLAEDIGDMCCAALLLTDWRTMQIIVPEQHEWRGIVLLGCGWEC